MNEPPEDEDDRVLVLQRSSASTFTKLKDHVISLVTLPLDENESGPAIKKKCSSIVLRVKTLLDGYQEDPQLLDAHLKELIPPLESRYLNLIQSPLYYQQKSSVIEIASSVAKILSTFCKVRGDKIISRFLSNDARYIDSVLNALELTESHLQDLKGWEQHYLLLLWLAHLVLTPFDLRTVSSRKTSQERYGEWSLPENVPGIVGLIVASALKGIESPTKSQLPAASVLVVLALRPDMRVYRLLDKLVDWALGKLKNSNSVDQIHLSIGALRIIARLCSPTNAAEICQRIPQIYACIVDVFTSENRQQSACRTSAVARQLSVKTQRNIIVSALRGDVSAAESFLDVSRRLLVDFSALEDTIDRFLKLLADRDTPVRFAASKAIGIITSQLDFDVAQEVVEAVIDSMNEDVIIRNTEKTLSAVNPLRWHGLTLTLAHMLFRRSPSPAQLSKVLSALYTALAFEQRSPLGAAIGSNVRDAANFGLWSLARKYTSAELSKVNPEDLEKIESTIGHQTIFQTTAQHLITAACLDPVGNVRRGSSAALQEFIGRHPDRVHEGISLVQVIDYQAVGLQSRAIKDLSFQASQLDTSYRLTLLDALFGWRGVSSSNEAARSDSAIAIGRLTGQGTTTEMHTIIGKCKSKLKRLSERDIEERHGLTLMLAVLYEEAGESLRHAVANQIGASNLGPSESAKLVIDIATEWQVFERELIGLGRSLSPSSSYASMLASSMLSLKLSISKCLLVLRNDPNSATHHWLERQNLNPADSIEFLTICLKATDASNADLIRSACHEVCQLLEQKVKCNLVQRWLNDISGAGRSTRMMGLLVGIASCWISLGEERNDDSTKPNAIQEQILALLTERASPKHLIETRVVACRSLGIIMQSVGVASASLKSELEHRAMPSIVAALDDYTTNERGDVGSLVRLAGIETISEWWNFSLDNSALTQRSSASVYRLALERLDKVRLKAVEVLRVHSLAPFDREASLPTNNLSDISSYDYFLAMGTILTIPASFDSDKNESSIASAAIAGFVSCTSPASSSLADTARSALLTILQTIPNTSAHDHEPSLLSILRLFQELFAANTPGIAANDRLTTSLLDFLAFTIDAGLLQRVESCESNTERFKPRRLLSLVQKAHFKSSNMPRLLSAVECYRGLAGLSSIRAEVLVKLKSMLSHRFPKVRVAVAETLWIVTRDETLLGHK